MDMRKQKRKVSHYYCLYTDFHYDIHQYTRLIKTAPRNEVLPFISSIKTQQRDQRIHL